MMRAARPPRRDERRARAVGHFLTYASGRQQDISLPADTDAGFAAPPRSRGARIRQRCAVGSSRCRAGQPIFVTALADIIASRFSACRRRSRMPPHIYLTRGAACGRVRMLPRGRRVHRAWRAI